VPAAGAGISSWNWCFQCETADSRVKRMNSSSCSAAGVVC
jgi:hypothetical protein